MTNTLILKRGATREAIEAALEDGTPVYTLNPARGWVECDRNYLTRAVAFHRRLIAEGHGRSFQWRTDLYAI